MLMAAIAFHARIFLAQAATGSTAINLTAANVAVDGAAPAAVGPWAVEFIGPRGVVVKYRGVTIIRQSSLYVVKPGWSGLLFDGRSQNYRIEKSAAAGGPALTATGENSVFRARYQLEALDERRFRLRFEGRLVQDVSASIEFAAGYFNANLIANRPFRAQTKSGERSGIVPAFPASAEQIKNELAPDFHRVEFDSRIGTIGLQVQSVQPAARVSFFDARRDSQDWAKAAPVFWCGLMAGAWPLKAEQPVRLELLLTVRPITPPARRRVPVKAPLRRVVGAQSSRERPLQVIPQPKRIRFALPASVSRNQLASGDLLLRDGLAWTVTAPVGEVRVTDALRSLLRDQFGLKTAEAAPHRSRNMPRHADNASNNSKNEWTTVRLGALAQPGSPSHEAIVSAVAPDADWVHKGQGYRLTASANGIEIVAPTARGAFYGVQTLAQLLRPASSKQGGGASGSGRTVRCPLVTIEDWPTLKFRGAHWFPSASGVPFHKALIERVMARHKMNYAVIQCEAARWDTHPEIAAPNSISKRDLRDLVALCRRHFIEPVPLINVPGHAEWMFRNGANRDLAKDPETPYAYSINNPRSDVFIKGILGEALDVFSRRFFIWATTK